MAIPSSTSSKASFKNEVNLAQPDLGEAILDSNDHHASLSKPWNQEIVIAPGEPRDSSQLRPTSAEPNYKVGPVAGIICLLQHVGDREARMAMDKEAQRFICQAEIYLKPTCSPFPLQTWSMRLLS